MACRRCRALGHFPWKWNTPRVMPVDQRVASNIEDVAKMDPDWAISEIDEFVRVTDQVAYDNRPGSGVVHFGTHMRGSGTGTEAAQRAHVVEQILDRVLSGWERDRPKKDETYRWLRGQASRAKAALQRQEELAEKLGDNAPDMDAANLHSWAWENGKSYWNTGHYNQAVMQAAIRINAETQSKLGRMDVSETALFNEAFSLDPPKSGASRLRLALDDGGKTYQNLQRDARAFADGLYSAIRNPGMHYARAKRWWRRATRIGTAGRVQPSGSLGRPSHCGSSPCLTRRTHVSGSRDVSEGTSQFGRNPWSANSWARPRVASVIEYFEIM